jgi:predicted transcriptional regulator
MDKNRIIKSVKRQEEEKVAVSLKLPASLKDQLQTIAEKESISMNSIIVAVIQSFIDDDCGKKLQEASRWLNERKDSLSYEFYRLRDDGVSSADEAIYLESLEAQLKLITSFLKDIE